MSHLQTLSYPLGTETVSSLFCGSVPLGRPAQAPSLLQDYHKAAGDPCVAFKWDPFPGWAALYKPVNLLFCSRLHIQLTPTYL